MIDVSELIKKAAKTELEIYAGILQPKSILPADAALLQTLKSLSVGTALALNGPQLEQPLYEICRDLRGEYQNIEHLRARADKLLLSAYISPGFRLLTILPIGIYVGEPEDIANCWDFENRRIINGKQPLYPVQSFGTRAMYLSVHNLEELAK